MTRNEAAAIYRTLRNRAVTAGLATAASFDRECAACSPTTPGAWVLAASEMDAIYATEAHENHAGGWMAGSEAGMPARMFW